MISVMTLIYRMLNARDRLSKLIYDPKPAAVMKGRLARILDLPRFFRLLQVSLAEDEEKTKAVKKTHDCNHTYEETGDSAIKKHGNLHGQFKTCQLCRMRWKLAEGEWTVHDGTAATKAAKAKPTAKASSAKPSSGCSRSSQASKSERRTTMAARPTRSPEAPPQEDAAFPDNEYPDPSLDQDMGDNTEYHVLSEAEQEWYRSDEDL